MTPSERQLPVRDPIVIIGIGNTLRSDDGVGPLVLDACRYEPIPGCELVELDGEASRVIEAWRDRELAIVVDAVCTGDHVGTVHDLSIDPRGSVRTAAALASPQFAGVVEAVRLGLQLDRLPRSLRVLGIEPGDMKRGFGLSPAVAASMDELVERVRAAVATLSDDRRSGDRLAE